jgi:hypothetical protein
MNVVVVEMPILRSATIGRTPLLNIQVFNLFKVKTLI